MPDNVLLVAVKGLVLHQRRMLLMHTAPGEELPGLWECPGGKMRFGEEIPDALRREVLEETGLRVRVERLLYAATFYTRPWRQLVVLTHLCHANSDQVRLSDEHDAFLWADRAQIRAQIAPPILEDFRHNRILETLDLA